MSFGLKIFLYTAMGFIAIQGSYILFFGHLSSNDSLVECLLLLFVAKRTNRAIGREDRRSLIGNG